MTFLPLSTLSGKHSMYGNSVNRHQFTKTCTGFTPPHLTLFYIFNFALHRLNGLNQHDFHARWLDNAVPGFTTPDPLAERNWAESPYVYCGSNPVNRIDPLGMDWYWNKAGNKTPVWFESSKDVPGFDTHSPSCWLYSQNFRYFFAENGNIYVYPLEGGDLYHSFERNQESLYNAYGFVPPRHDEDEENSENVSDGISISSPVLSDMLNK